MVEGFCLQVEKLDFHPNVKQLTESLCGPLAPFGRAEVILSDRGSRLFRSFVDVNSEASSSVPYRVLSSMSSAELNGIAGETRRNLVWGLEKLCFHKALFPESAWSILLLATAENESCSNNAQGMFAQLFRIHLSGTEASPKQRFNLLELALQENASAFDVSVLNALKTVVSQSSQKGEYSRFADTLRLLRP
jgi:hypothetical protein